MATQPGIHLKHYQEMREKVWKSLEKDLFSVNAKLKQSLIKFLEFSSPDFHDNYKQVFNWERTFNKQQRKDKNSNLINDYFSSYNLLQEDEKNFQEVLKLVKILDPDNKISEYTLRYLLFNDKKKGVFKEDMYQKYYEDVLKMLKDDKFLSLEEDEFKKKFSEKMIPDEENFQKFLVLVKKLDTESEISENQWRWLFAKMKKISKETVTELDLLNKPNMTPKDLKNMQDVIEYLKNHNMKNSKNLWKLYSNVHYLEEGVKIWGIIWTREDWKSSKVGPNKSSYSEGDQYDGTTIYYVKETQSYHFNHGGALAEEEEQMFSMGKKIPTKEEVNVSLHALPWEFKEYAKYKWGNILYLLLKNSYGNHMIGQYNNHWNKLRKNENVWRTASKVGHQSANVYSADCEGGGETEDAVWRDNYFAIRPVLIRRK